jgi:hypothetical protein
MVRSISRSLVLVMTLGGLAAADPMPPEDSPMSEPVTKVEPAPVVDAPSHAAEPAKLDAKTDGKADPADTKAEAKKPTKSAKKATKKSARHKKSGAHHDKTADRGPSTHKKPAKPDTHKADPASTATPDPSP